MVMHKFLPLVMIIAISLCNQGHQERASRLVPGFQPYDHPSQKAVGGPPSRHSGPIGDVEWVEGRGHGEGGMPVFGAIKPPPPSSSSSISSSLLLLLLAGGVGAAALLRGKTSNAASKDDKRTGEPVIIPSPERQQPRVARETPHVPSTACHDNPPIVLNEKKEEKGKKEEKEPTKPSTTKQPNGSFKSNNDERKIETEVKEQNQINNEKSKEEKTILKTSDNAPLPKIALNGGDTEMKRVTKSEETSKTIPEIIVSQEVSNIANKVEPAKIIPTEQARTPSQTKTKFEDLPINITTVDEVEEVDYITKIKTFKITRWPKTHTADIVQHGPDDLLSVLLPIQLQKCNEWKPEITTSSADLSIEGANISRLLITMVVEKDEEESVSKTMTIKEYMVTISNKIIEDAVKAVREDCSMENIKRLAETIKKYRPESMEVKNVRKL